MSFSDKLCCRMFFYLFVCVALLCVCTTAVTKAQTVYTCPSQSSQPEYPLYRYPTDTSEIVAWLYGNVAGQMIDTGSGYTQIEVGATSGWLKNEQLCKDPDQTVQGLPANVLTWGEIRYRMVYSQPTENSEVKAKAGYGSSVQVLLIITDDEWSEVILQNGLRGYMRLADIIQEMHEEYYILGEMAYEKLNLRQYPNSKSKRLGRYFSGTLVYPVLSFRSQSGWNRVSVYGYTGWVRNEFLSTNSNIPFQPPIGSTYDTCPIYIEPDYQSERNGEINGSTKAEILGSTGAWIQIRLKEGKTGFIPVEKLSGPEPDQAVDNSFALEPTAVLYDANLSPSLTQAENNKIFLSGSRPWKEWQYSVEEVVLKLPQYTEGRTMVNEMVWVETDCLDLDW